MPSPKHNKKTYKWNGVTAAALLFGAILCVSMGVLAYYQHFVALMMVGGLSAALLLLLMAKLWHRGYVYRTLLSDLTARFDVGDRETLESSPFPVALVTTDGLIAWYNNRFLTEVLDGHELLGEHASAILGVFTTEQVVEQQKVNAAVGEERYTVTASPVPVKTERDAVLLYYWNDTEYKETTEEYGKSRPAVLSVYIDNLDELAAGARDSERMQMAGAVETVLEDFMGKTTGFMRKYDNSRFLLVVERRHIQQMKEERFSVLDRVRALKFGEVSGLTLSIGVGQGETLGECEELAHQSLEMALGRGGDQAAIKTGNGFEFYGGSSKDVERRTQVRTRVIALALRDLITSSDRVLLMGHRFSDADCLGASVALAAACRAQGKRAQIVVNTETSMATAFLKRYNEQEQAELFLTGEQALGEITDHTLLIVCDTHNPAMLECADVYKKAEKTVVIDHHRKAVDFIQDALIFYHEPSASSTSEMVTELLGYLDVTEDISRREAEGLLAGIVLDTHNFVIKSGVRTFEAAATLRGAGADTVAVKRMLGGDMELHRQKTDILARAEVYKNTVISTVENGGKGQRIAAAQAADELLAIQGVCASFVLFEEGGAVSISARSYGESNVQLIMEALGGGGHFTTAGVQMHGVTLEQALDRLCRAIDEQELLTVKEET